uniref:hypothetical protein n=1 Tax=Endozoicomonas sp. ONNA1 TaxID=2828740 RepID=UPI002149734E
SNQSICIGMCKYWGTRSSSLILFTSSVFSVEQTITVKNGRFFVVPVTQTVVTIPSQSDLDKAIRDSQSKNSQSNQRSGKIQFSVQSLFKTSKKSKEGKQ